MLTDEYRYKILKALEQNPEASQRDLARELGVSLGKVNFCLKALVDVGVLKMTNFKNSKNKLAYMYLLTPNGLKQKTIITERFLRIKLQEFEALEAEINILRSESNTVSNRKVSHP